LGTSYAAVPGADPGRGPGPDRGFGGGDRRPCRAGLAAPERAHQRPYRPAMAAAVLDRGARAGRSLPLRPATRRAALALGDAGQPDGLRAVAAGVGGLLLVHRQLRPLRRHLWLA